MLTKWLTDRPSRKSTKDRSFRLCLETLEQRNAPSGHGPGGDHDDHDHGPPPPHPGPPAQANVDAGIHSNLNAHNSFNNSTITDSFNNTINVVVNLPAAQSTVVGGLLGFSNFLSSAFSNPQLGSLLNDEIALAVDSYLTSPAISAMLPASVVTDLKADAATLSAAINSITANSPIAGVIGEMTFDFTLHSLTSVQPTI